MTIPHDAGSVCLISLMAMAVGACLPAAVVERLRRPAGCVPLGLAVVVLAGLLANVAVARLNGAARPRVNDEYGYLLIADTLAHGRLTNPTPADADHFASPHVLLRPTYTSKYPPAQGVALAAGQLLGRPIVGVWAACGLATAAVYWMLLAFVPPRWAVVGGLCVAVHPQFVDWGHSFWGGGVAALGGALVVGGWGRLSGGATGRTATLASTALAVGTVILANSRPYEGLVLTAPLFLSLAPRLRRWSWPTPASFAAVLLAGGLATCLYDFRVTGHPLRLPFVEYADRYDVAPKFWPLPLRSAPPAYPNETMRWVHAGFEVGGYQAWRSVPGLLVNTVRRAGEIVWTFAQPGLLVMPVLFAFGGPAVDRRPRWLWATAGLFAVGLWVESFYFPHYAAPAVGLAATLLVLGWRRLNALRPRVSRGLAVGFGVAALLADAGVGSGVGEVGHESLLDQAPALRNGRQLVFVRYAADHLPHDEWVYNGADPAGQPVLWARSLGPAADRPVVRDYPGRRVSLLTVGRHDMALNRYAP